MRLSVNCQNIDVAHRFYSDILGCKKVKDTELSEILKLDFFGHSLSLIETAGFNAVHMHVSVAAEDVKGYSAYTSYTKTSILLFIRHFWDCKHRMTAKNSSH